jgi:fatty acid CoA ligase FadD36
MNSESTLLRSLDPHIFDDHGAAVSFGEGATLSRADLLAAATAVADRIHGAQRVAVQAAAGVDTVVAVTGALIAGVAVVPIPPDSGPLERQHIIADSKAELLLGEGLSDSSNPLIPIDIHARSSTSYPEPNAAATALIMYTSGTTGAPKGVVLSRAAIAADLDALAHV